MGEVSASAAARLGPVVVFSAVVDGFGSTNPVVGLMALVPDVGEFRLMTESLARFSSYALCESSFLALHFRGRSVASSTRDLCTAEQLQLSHDGKSSTYERVSLPPARVVQQSLSVVFGPDSGVNGGSRGGAGERALSASALGAGGRGVLWLTGKPKAPAAVGYRMATSTCVVIDFQSCTFAGKPWMHGAPGEHSRGDCRNDMVPWQEPWFATLAWRHTLLEASSEIVGLG
ncbi:hypothetical protein FNF29_02703 [Cafeteria roenbergensis]|uniref:Uncharacterized protein n=1 Tax=Cafeteria roenbergensis TaxID=33653 RepID=A0A5A8CPF3_CAFRO|nr:hypothetical protein FNF29_02703 [Cafeteria roenbergensis]|eukprot:KAA0154080.1 hypothetical protein FNF29_02703 [Cafeteria roenbergensis]